jgi:DNA primase
VERTVKSARSLLEHLIEATLDQTFAANDAHGLAARIHEVAELIRSEEDPSVRAVGQRHADALAARLSNGNAGTLRAWASVVERAGAGAPSAAAPPMVAPPERARSRDRRLDLGLEILGAILDFPLLLESPDVLEAVAGAEGEAALAIAALRQEPGLVGNPEHLLAKLPRSIHPFAAARLAAPRHQAMDDAKAELLGNVEKLNRLELSRHKSEVMEELTRVQASGDFDREMILLGEQARRVRERHGL